MKKNVVQDVVPPKKSIRNIRLNSEKEARKVPRAESKKETLPRDEFTRTVPIQAPIKIEPKIPETNPVPQFSSYKYEFEDKKPRSKKWVYVSLIVLLLAVSFGVSSLFRSANIKVSPKQESRSFTENFSAKKDALGGLGYQTVTISKEIEKTVKSTGEEKVERKSRGTIIIYNNFSKDAQKLVATTRFQTPDGLIYRLIDPVTIPGQTVKDGKTIAGSIEVTVEADKPGISYNIGLKDFTIPGFKGDPKYTSVYARSKTEMTGGFSGMQKTVTKEALAQQEKEMLDSLKASLSKEISAQIPANFLYFDGGLSYDSDPIVQVGATSGDEVVLKKKGRATAIIFDKAILTGVVLAKVLPQSKDESIKISNLQNLSFKITSSSSDTVGFSLSGDANFVWTFDQNKLEDDLLGLSKKSAMTVMSSYPGIKEAWVETKPFWNQKIPNDKEKVNLVNTLQE